MHTATQKAKITNVLVKKQYFSGRLLSFQTWFTWKPTYREPQNFFTKIFKNNSLEKNTSTLSSSFNLGNSPPRQGLLWLFHREKTKHGELKETSQRNRWKSSVHGVPGTRHCYLSLGRSRNPLFFTSTQRRTALASEQAEPGHPVVCLVSSHHQWPAANTDVENTLACKEKLLN